MRVDVEDLPALALFARVVQLRSFTAAAAEAGLGKAAVSQRITRLEERLAVQLLRRSSRKLSLTADGMRLFEHAASLVDVTRAANSALAAGHTPRGRVKLNAPASLHRGELARSLQQFLVQYPAVTLHVTLDDRLLDLVEGDYDVLLRVIETKSRTFVARKLASERIVVVGSPAYLDRAPPLSTPYDLVHHVCLRNAALPERVDWRLGRRGERTWVPVRSQLESADFGLLYEAALAGAGLLVTLSRTVRDDLRAGRLRAVLTDYSSEPMGIFAVVAERAKPSAATRALIEHLVRSFRAKEPRAG
jgi:DNA-binding transcriptional LysR family regulator